MLKKTALSCAASAFTAVPGHQYHLQTSSPPPAPPTPPASHTTCHPNPTQTYLNLFSLHSHPHTSIQPNNPHSSPISNPSIFPRPYPLAFPYIPESFSQCFFVIHPLRGKTLISLIFL
ncbi:hypothetical protein C2M15_22690 [Klebsiella pneumoniae]|nr:hypothetical protein C2M15_22690 [Klebsiella pneumoniae]